MSALFFLGRWDVAKLEIELNNELSERLQRVASKVALSPAETAKMLLAHQLTNERKIDWLAVISKARDFIRRFA